MIIVILATKIQKKFIKKKVYYFKPDHLEAFHHIFQLTN